MSCKYWRTLQSDKHTLHCSCHLVSNSRLSPKNGIGVPIIVVVIVCTLVVVDPEIYIDIDPLIVNIN